MNKSSAKIIIKSILKIVLILVFIIYLSPIALQNDTFFDIKLGEQYLTNGINTNDIYSIHGGLKYISHHFMVNIITYLTYDLGGFNALYILVIGLALLFTFLMYRLNRTFIKSKTIAYLFLFIEMFCFREYLCVRAQMYSFIIFALEILLLENFIKKGSKKYIVLLTVLPMVLANFHAGTIPYYFLIIIAYLTGMLKFNFQRIEYDSSIVKRLKLLFIPLIIGVFVTFINPFFIDGVTYAFKTVGNSFISNNIREFAPFKITTSFGMYAFMYYSIFIFSLILTDKKIKLNYFILFSGTFLMSLTAIRYYSLFVIVSVVLLPHVEELIMKIKNTVLSGIKEDKKVYIKYYLILVYLILIIMLAAHSQKDKAMTAIPLSDYPVNAVQYIRQNIPSDAKIFNEYSWGSYMMLNDIKVFIDSRCDLYTEEYNPQTNVAFDYIDAINCVKNYNEIMDKYDIDYIFVNKNSALAKNCLDDSNKVKIYEDNISVIIKINK